MPFRTSSDAKCACSTVTISGFPGIAKRRLPGPIFNYIDGAADDETTYRRNTASFERCDLVPNVLRGVENCRHVGHGYRPEARNAGLLFSDRVTAAVSPSG